MAPTEQDKEIRELLYTLLKTDPRADTYVIPYRVMDIFVEYITADRKRVALEARLDELLHLDDQSIGTDWKANAWFSVSDRIYELKAQQEEV